MPVQTYAHPLTLLQQEVINFVGFLSTQHAHCFRRNLIFSYAPKAGCESKKLQFLIIKCVNDNKRARATATPQLSNGILSKHILFFF